MQMSSQEMRDLCEIRRLVTKRRAEILDELESKKRVGKQECKQWIDSITDLVITFDTNTADNTTTTVQTIDSKENTIDSNGSDDDSDHPKREEVRFRGVIRGLDSINSGDDWEPKGGKKKVKKSNRQTRGKGKDKKEDKSEKKSTDLWTSDGQVLGGESAEVKTEMSAEEKRVLMAQKTEQRLAQLESRGAKGVVRLPTAKVEGRGDGLSALDNNSNPLKWQF